MANSIDKSRSSTENSSALAKEAGGRNTLEIPVDDGRDISGNTSVSGLEIDNEKQNAATETADEVPPREIKGVKWAIVVAAILSSTFLFALDNTIVADIQPTIVTHFNDVGKLTWLSVSFLIGAASTNLLWGKVFGQFNAKWTYIICILLFEIGSAICGAAPTIDALIIGRAICGVGGAGMYVGVMTLLAATTTLHERPMYIGGTGLTWGLGTVLGPIIGGAFVESSAGWRFAFYINLFIGGLCAPVYIFMLPSVDPRPGVSVKDRAREMDFVGGFLSTAAFVLGVMAVSMGGITWAWNDGKVIGMFVASGVLFILFGFQQVWCIFTTEARRIFPVQFFKSRTILILFCMTSAGGTAIFIPIYMIPVFFQFVHSDTALESGVRLLPFIMLTIFAIISNGAIMSATGYYMPWYTAGGALVIIGGSVMYTVNVHTSVAMIYGFCILIGFGVGLFAQASFSVAQAIVPPEEVPSAVGFITCAQTSGITIALAIANSLFLNGAQDNIQAVLPNVPQAQIQAAIAGVGSDLVKSLSVELKELVLQAIVTAISRTYILVIVAGALVLVLSAGMKREKLFLQAGHAG